MTLKLSEFKYCTLSGCYFISSNLHHVEFIECDMTFAKFNNARLNFVTLFKAQLRGVNFHGSNILESDLCKSSLIDTDLTHSMIHNTSLYNTDLTGADLDFSNFQLSCNSLRIKKVDARLVKQLLYHTLTLAKACDAPEVKQLLKLKSVKALANQFHRIDECGEIK
jgi:uncharacterized protein YjbI with pentapeptide repeats